MKSAYIERQFKMNSNTTVKIKYRKAKDADIYINTVTVEQTTSSIEPMNVFSEREIVAMVKDIDLKDDQQHLIFGSDED